jgi:anti-anti-sigma regulatory factor
MQTLAKWDETLEKSYQTTQRLILVSVSPAIKRILILVEELQGWEMS